MSGYRISDNPLMARLILVLLALSFLAPSFAKDPLGDLIRGYIDKKTQIKPVEVIKRISEKDRTVFEEMFIHIVARSLFERKKVVSQTVLRNHETAYMGNNIFHVYGTSFGKPGNKGESAYFKDGSRVVDGIVTGALPDNSAVGKFIVVRRPLGNGKYTGWVRMPIKDLGPWFRDDPYWVTRSAPRAVEYFKHKKRRWDGRLVVNPAGIDLTPWAWQKLGIPKEQSYNYSGYVEWKFSN
ncbi:MAG: hypothetical protein H3C47_01050 [Candidatus Cloacimonetes bacterium]|nr:hypothetical protein [Candidatus Cloacimonadota bacterium]